MTNFVDTNTVRSYGIYQTQRSKHELKVKLTMNFDVVGGSRKSSQIFCLRKRHM